MSATYVVPLPDATDAEWELVGCALVALDAAALAVDRLDRSDFHDAAAWRALVACLDAPRDEEARLQHVAEVARVEPARLRAAIEHRSVYADLAGTVARRVREAAARRRELYGLLARLEAEFDAEPVREVA